MHPYTHLAKAAVLCGIPVLLPCGAAAETAVVDLGASGFTNPAAIDNRYWPMVPGSAFTYVAATEDGCEFGVFAVTADTREVEVDGTAYTTRVVRDQAWVHEPGEGEECDPALASLEEDTRDFYAQDDEGNLWYFGEDTWSVDPDSGECSQAGSWEAGVDGAQPGIAMLAEPAPGLRYRQEYYEDEAEDWAAVLRVNARVDIDYGAYEDCLVTREWTPLEAGSIEQKFYCPEEGGAGPGLVFVKELKGRTVRVEYTGPGPLGAPGEGSAEFPAAELGCGP